MGKTFESVDAWRQEGIRLFGKDASKWKFICPSCDRVFSVKEFLDVGGDSNAIGEECISRYNNESKCCWCAYGLFDICDDHIMYNGKRHPVFSFAEDKS